MKKYEYLKLEPYINNEMIMVIWYKGKELNFDIYSPVLIDKLGSEGWELVNAVPITSTEFENQAFIPIRADTIAPFVYTAKFILYFKRELVGDVKYQETKEYKELVKIDKEYDMLGEVRELTAESLVDKYISMGYQNTFNHKSRLVFEDGNSTIRFDKINDMWVLYSPS